MPKSKNILIYRFSALGDVALMVPVVQELALANPEIQIFVATRTAYAPLFENITNVQLIHANLNKQHRGLLGLVRLFIQMKKKAKPGQVFDMHRVIRTKIINFLFAISGTKVYKLNKGRKEKNAILKSKKITTLMHASQRYAEVFEKEGYTINLPKKLSIEFSADELRTKEKILVGLNVNQPYLLIAPFAKHNQKIWGMEKTEQLIEKLTKEYPHQILLLGGGEAEKTMLEKLESRFNKTISLAGKFQLRTELAIISQAKVMLSMDSANMHLAALTGIPVVSIWGATHPCFGFTPISQPISNIIQVAGEELTCRPCSVYGAKPCTQHSLLCMEIISVDQVLQKLKNYLG
jgi:ADP-heptose:LPS heptosyltransferase